jgi:hypothetical protein
MVSLLLILSSRNKGRPKAAVVRTNETIMSISVFYLLQNGFRG